MIDKTAQANVTPSQRATDESLESLLGEVAGEFFDQMTSGQRPQIEDYVARYPEIAEQIRSAFPALQIVGDSRAESKLQRTEIDVTGQKTLGDFRILHELGRGGMGVVYEAEQLSMGRKVAIKVLPFAALAREKSLQRFRNEVRAAGSLNHPNIVPIYSVGDERGVHFFAMQLIRGQTMAEVIAQLVHLQTTGQPLHDDSISQALSVVAGLDVGGSADEPTQDFASKRDEDSDAAPAQDAPQETQARISTESHTDSRPDFVRSAVRLGVQAAEALQHAHDLGVLHRDIKPGNLMLDAEGQLYVTDFGLARIETDVGVTMTGDIVGTLRYMSPEQALAKRIVIDHRTDIYSLGVTLYELLTLCPPFDGENRQELLTQIAFEDPAKPRQINRSISRELETIILKAIEKNPDERYATAGELAEDLQAFLENRPIKAKPPTVIQRSAKWSRRHKPLVCSAGVSSALLLVISFVFLVISNVFISNERDLKIQALDAKEKALVESQENFNLARDAVNDLMVTIPERGQLDTMAVQQQLLTKALAYYTVFIARREGDATLTEDLADAYWQVGQITLRMGRRDDAIKAHRNAYRHRQELVVESPEDTDYQLALGHSCRKMSSFARNAGNWKSAGMLSQQALEIAQRLCSNRPSEEHRDLLAKSHTSLSHYYLSQGEIVTAVKQREDGIRLLRQIAQDVPENSYYGWSLGGALMEIGDLYRNTDQLAKAVLALEESIELFKQLSAEGSMKTRSESHLANAYRSLADVQATAGNRAEALNNLRAAIDIGANVTKANPLFQDARLGLAHSHQQLARSYETSHQWDEAVASWSIAVSELRKLFEQDNGNQHYEQELARAIQSHAHAQQFATGGAQPRNK